MSIMYAAGMMGGRDAVQDTASHGTETTEQQASVEDVYGKAVNRFELTDQLGRKFRSEEMLGKIWVASIFFADCPGFCPQQNRQMQLIQNEFGDLGVECVSITCDPEKDTPPRLLSYSSKFDA
ncbi:MAG: SCO family protein, partial [Planctomycetaceae bacterium]|nr:SCO family protein [Planctomycetaceae bacterium]